MMSRGEEGGETFAFDSPPFLTGPNASPPPSSAPYISLTIFGRASIRGKISIDERRRELHNAAFEWTIIDGFSSQKTEYIKLAFFLKKMWEKKCTAIDRKCGLEEISPLLLRIFKGA